MHNEGFKTYCKQRPPQCLQTIPGATDGIWESLFASKLLVTVIIKMSFSDSWAGTSHGFIIKAVREITDKTPALVMALTSACDMNVQDDDSRVTTGPDWFQQ